MVNYDDLSQFSFDKLVENSVAVIFSPGPGHPSEYGLSLKLYQSLPPTMPVLGVCLGHQIMLSACGARLAQVASIPVHGRQIKLSQKILSRFLPSRVLQGRFVLYNSWGIPASDVVFKNHFNVLASRQGFVLMAEHKTFPHVCTQFHPESFASTGGDRLLNSFLRLFYRC